MRQLKIVAWLRDYESAGIFQANFHFPYMFLYIFPNADLYRFLNHIFYFQTRPQW